MIIDQNEIFHLMQENFNNLNAYTSSHEFFYNLLHAYGLPRNIITLMPKGAKNLFSGVGGSITFNRKVYFKQVTVIEDIDNALEVLITSELITNNRIHFVLVTDFERVVAYDVKNKQYLKTSLDLLANQYDFFLTLAGFEVTTSFIEHPSDIAAAKQMGYLVNWIKNRNEITSLDDHHSLNVFLNRLLFCFYAEDTGIFSKDQFTNAITAHTQENGWDTGDFLYQLFEVLNLEPNSPKRHSLPAYLAAFPHIDNGLFTASYESPKFSSGSRQILLSCGALDWEDINPDIFGSMFQAVVNTEQRGNLGQHYTSVPNIMRVIKPLILDNLEHDLDNTEGDKDKLHALLIRLSRIRAVDFACGSGNFLIIAYKEIRSFEIKVIELLRDVYGVKATFVSRITLDQFYGVEIDDFAAEIAVLSLCIAEHQMNNIFAQTLGYEPVVYTSSTASNISCANSLRVDWRKICPKQDSEGNPFEIYVLGNPPFLGDGSRSQEQLRDMDTVLADFKSKRNIDYIATFFWKGAQYIKDGGALAFVSTNSICQSTQASILWTPIIELGVEINFAYQSFPWSNNAKNKAMVHVVIIGLGTNSTDKVIYKDINGITQKTVVDNISPYLLDGSNLVAKARSKPFYDVSLMTLGSKPTDGGHLILSPDEKDTLIQNEPLAAEWIKPFIGASEFLKNNERYCLWLVDANQADIDAMPLVKKRVAKVKSTRLASKAVSTKKLADKPHLFEHTPQPLVGSYLVMPRVSSERREYVPIAFVDSGVIASDRLCIIPNASLYEFGLLNSMMHNVWLAAVGGRMKSDYSYSSTVVYNTFPWPESTDEQRSHIELLAKEIENIRMGYPDQSLAGLYDPDKMPGLLRAAHKALDVAVDALYRETAFSDNIERLEHLFDCYEKLVTE